VLTSPLITTPPFTPRKIKWFKALDIRIIVMYDGAVMISAIQRDLTLLTAAASRHSAVINEAKGCPSPHENLYFSLLFSTLFIVSRSFSSIIAAATTDVWTSGGSAACSAERLRLSRACYSFSLWRLRRRGFAPADDQSGRSKL